MSTKCFYHSADLDGYCSGAIVGLAYGWKDVDFRPINYNDSFPWEDITSEDIVIMTDFSLQPFDKYMPRLNRTCKKLIWIDHHKSAIEEEQKWLDMNPDIGPIEGIRSQIEAACELAWKWFFPHKDLPKAVYHLGRYDVWNWETHKDCLEFQMGMRLFDFLNPIDWEKNECKGLYKWRTLLGREDPDILSLEIAKIIKNGEIIIQYRSNKMSMQSKELAFMTELSGLPVIAANIGLTNSQFFDSVLDRYPEAKAVMTFHYRKKCWNISLYGIESRDTPDLGAIAKTYGGGGHHGAAGFNWYEQILPFSIEMKGDEK